MKKHVLKIEIELYFLKNSVSNHKQNLEFSRELKVCFVLILVLIVC